MTNLTLFQGVLQLDVQGMDKIWALKSSLTVPLEHIRGVEMAGEETKTWFHGLKFGSNIPGVLTAGTFFKVGEVVFWDVHNPNNAIAIHLHDEQYQKLVIEVENPRQAIMSITSALA